jgi:hypothetical protein
MNEFLPERYAESVRRLALGVEPRDAMRASRVPHPLQVLVDGIPLAPPRHLRDPRIGPWEEEDVLERIPRKSSCRHVLIYREGVEDPLSLRLLDRLQRYVPRRLRIRLPDPATLGRVCRPALFPGAAYGLVAGALGVRGRVLREGAPMRWARVEASRISDEVVVGRAHGDQHGEFLLLLSADAVVGADLEFPLRVEVTVFGPDEPPDPDADPAARDDPLWDLPLEEVPLSPLGERVLSGEELPEGYVRRDDSSREVEITPEGPVREEFDFS